MTENLQNQFEKLPVSSGFNFALFLTPKQNNQSDGLDELVERLNLNFNSDHSPNHDMKRHSSLVNDLISKDLLQNLDELSPAKSYVSNNFDLNDGGNLFNLNEMNDSNDSQISPIKDLKIQENNLKEANFKNENLKYLITNDESCSTQHNSNIDEINKSPDYSIKNLNLNLQSVEFRPKFYSSASLKYRNNDNVYNDQLYVMNQMNGLGYTPYQQSNYIIPNQNCFGNQINIPCNNLQNQNDFNFSKFQKIDKKKKIFVEREGDWVCNKCKNLNFSFRVVCNRCHLSKSESSLINQDQFMSQFTQKGNLEYTQIRQKVELMKDL